MSSSNTAAAGAAPSSPPRTFERTPVPKPSSQDKDSYVHTAACLIIGDEVLNGKTKDSNSNFLAKMCFDFGIELKRIEVIADDEDEIVEAARRMTEKYDMVITSGGIGPTHDASRANYLQIREVTYTSLIRILHIRR